MTRKRSHLWCYYHYHTMTTPNLYLFHRRSYTFILSFTVVIALPLFHLVVPFLFCQQCQRFLYRNRVLAVM